MKLKFKKGILLSISAIALLSFGSCKEKYAISKKDEKSLKMTENDSISLERFDKKYFSNFNKSFIPDTDNKNLWNNDTLVMSKEDSARAFHTWSWQKYLHLTQNRRKKDTLEHELPLFLDNDSIFQITPIREKVVFSEGVSLKLDSTHQAAQNAVLKTNPDYSSDKKEYTVYYSIHMNQTMYNDMENIYKNNLTSIEKLLQRAKNNEKKLIKDDVFLFDEKYTNGAFELKAAWVEIEAIEKDKRSQYITVDDATINNKKKKVALIGLHIVGMVEGFPELLWATFEGNDLAPDRGGRMNSNMLLSKLNNNYHDDNITYEGKGDTGKPNVPYSVFRLHPLGYDKDKANNDEKYRDKYEKHYLLTKDINSKANSRKITYFYNGNVWMSGKEKDKLNIIKDGKIKENIAGSPQAANVTMETYFQSSKAIALNNCFTCHNGSKNVSKLDNLPNYTITFKGFPNTSHVFNDYLAEKTKLLSEGSNSENAYDRTKKDMMEYLENLKRSEEIKIERIYNSK